MFIIYLGLSMPITWETLERDNSFTMNIRKKRGCFIGRVHSILQEVHLANPLVKMEMINMYASSFYGSPPDHVTGFIQHGTMLSEKHSIFPEHLIDTLLKKSVNTFTLWLCYPQVLSNSIKLFRNLPYSVSDTCLSCAAPTRGLIMLSI